MTIEQRLDVAARFAERDPVVLAAAEVRRREIAAIDNLHILDNVDIPELRLYKLLWLGPLLDRQDDEMTALTEAYGLVLGDRYGEEVITSTVLYDPNKYRLDLKENQPAPQQGDLVVVMNSSLYEISGGNRLVPIFEAVVTPFEQE